MGVVPAGMHEILVGAPVVDLLHVLNAKCVDVGAQTGLEKAHLRVGIVGDHASSGGSNAVLDAPVAQEFGDPRAGSKLLATGFRMSMEVSSPGAEFTVKVVDPAVEAEKKVVIHGG